MTENNKRLSRSDIGLLFIAAVVLIPGLAALMHGLLGDFGLTLTDLTVSALLTTALVILYSRQTQMLESQRDLLTQEMNREARQQHTETLRERIRLWHGEPETTATVDPSRSSDTNLPSVGYSSFNSAPTGGVDTIGSDEDEFKVIPYHLTDDRYLHDLLDNHATDLDEQKAEIEELQQKFQSLRKEFKHEFDAAIVEKKDDYSLEPSEYFNQWIFEHLVAEKRGKYENYDGMRERVIGRLREGSTTKHPEEPRIWILANLGDRNRAVYSAVGRSADWDPNMDKKSDIGNETQRIVAEVFDTIESEAPYETIEEAASVLDDGEDAIKELRQLLVEYDGRPIFTGDCKYLKEARLSTT
jgi:hypothetical protein